MMRLKKQKFSSYELKKFRKRKKQEKFLKRTFDEKKVEEPPVVDLSLIQNLRTLSIAVPGSIMLNAQTKELQTYLAGQIARAAAIFNVDEVIIFDDTGSAPVGEGLPLDDKKWDACVKLGHILQYLECPQYLRKHFFPAHRHLELAGLLNPLNAPHHYKIDEDAPFREGVVTTKPVKEGSGVFVNVGLYREVKVDKVLVPGIRVTVKMLPQPEGVKKLKGLIVPPSLPRAESGIYWGYSVRMAKSLSKVFTESPYEGGYDLSIGTSDKGTPVSDFSPHDHKHGLVVFGGMEGIESAVESDADLNVDVNSLFDFYLNTCPNQGSRTIRTEEAILISLTQLSNKLIS